MSREPMRICALALRLMVGLALLVWPRVGVAQGTWSVISLPQKPGEILFPFAVAVDATGNLYVASLGNGGRLQKRDAQGGWSVIASLGRGPGQVDSPTALAVDAAGNLYVAEAGNNSRIQKRDAQGQWSTVSTCGGALSQVYAPTALVVDTAGNFYVAESRNGSHDCTDFGACNNRIQQRDAQGIWSVIADEGGDLGQVIRPDALAVDPVGNLYVVDQGADGNGQIQKRDTQANWSILALQSASALAVDAADNLYVAGGDIRKRDAQGNWSLIATEGSALGQVNEPFGLAADAAGNLYVADTGNNRVLKYAPGP